MPLIINNMQNTIGFHKSTVIASRIPMNRLSDFDYVLPPEQIAQRPLDARDASRMLVLDRASGRFLDDRFAHLPSLLRGDELLVMNNTRVIRARLFARREAHARDAEHRATGDSLLPARIELFLVRHLQDDDWEALVRPGRKVRTGERLRIEGQDLQAEVIGRGSYGLRRLRFFGVPDVPGTIDRAGHVPLPPYIRRSDEAVDQERYQTVIAARPGAVAAPTAGLHFTQQTLADIRSRGVEICEITLEVGLGTFQSVHVEDLDQHVMHGESYEISPAAAQAIARARGAGRPILAVGTTVVRALEDAAQKAVAGGASPHELTPGGATAGIFIRPGHRFALVDQLLTNFHLPRSTLLVLVAAFAGRERILSAYRHAVAAGYRFYSYGDCMLVR
jgi:S-adenosylmethionine:tRNA ribosyltransferase-isomerase